MSKFQRGVAWTLGIILGVGLLLRVLAFKVWTVPDDPVLAASVAPTLAGDDTVVLLFRGKPGFGDLVRCADPETPGRYTVGRIVGTEGDVVEIDGHRLVVNGKKYDNYSACPKPKFNVAHPTSGSDVELRCDVVEMGGGWHYRGYSAKPFVSQKDRVEVSEGMVFLLSDDREFHDDSRDYGQMPASACTERIIFRLWGKEAWSDSSRRNTFIH